MNSRMLRGITTIAGFVALALPVQLAAQQQRYKLIDLGTFGGPNSFVNGPGVRDFSNAGTYVGDAETDIPDPFAPNCMSPDCLVGFPQKWSKGVVSALSSLPGVNLTSGATWISADGRFISGASDNGIPDPITGALTEGRGVFWTTDGQIHDLDTLEGGTESFAASVNSQGQVIGVSNNAIPDPFSMSGWGTQTRAVLWQNGTIQDIGTLGGPDAGVLAINERGQITGQSYTNSIPNATTGMPTVDPFLWEDGRMIDIGNLGGTIGITNASNNNGQVAGIMYLAGDVNFHPFSWIRAVLTDIGTFGGSTGEALRVSDSGFVVGRADFAGDFIHHAFVWKDGVMHDVGVVPGDLCTNGRAINSRGQAIGTSTDCMGTVEHMFLWENGSIHDLTAMILPGSDIKVFEAWDINDRGEIAAVGMLPNGDQHAVLLIPASASEIAAAGALGVSQPASHAMHIFVKDADNSLSSNRSRGMNLFLRVRREP